MTRHRRTPPDPQPGDFDAELEALDPRDVERRPGDPDAKVTRIAGYERGHDGRIVRWWVGEEETPGT